MADQEILDRLLKCYRIYLDGDVKPVEGYDDTFYDGVLWAFARLPEIQPSDDNLEDKPQGEWGKWVITEIQCPTCFGYFETDCYSTEELQKCPDCGADMRGGAE